MPLNFANITLSMKVPENKYSFTVIISSSSQCNNAMFSPHKMKGLEIELDTKRCFLDRFCDTLHSPCAKTKYIYMYYILTVSLSLT